MQVLQGIAPPEEAMTALLTYYKESAFDAGESSDRWGRLLGPGTSPAKARKWHGCTKSEFPSRQGGKGLKSSPRALSYSLSVHQASSLNARRFQSSYGSRRASSSS